MAIVVAMVASTRKRETCAEREDLDGVRGDSNPVCWRGMRVTTKETRRLYNPDTFFYWSGRLLATSHGRDLSI